ncbi:sugar phosphate isomerase/epimerase family protein [Jeotgalibaca ciconiae]|uniref:Sugar phosphate isomerase/epimerase n=1 Tax=Jeotgalibaca ciconiae TaxID=2496265 RepID=A0A3Q9BMD0_9LACT|nr:sugar phosphate isomerase/epimerase [Jeotgalibaca ciconiae]AZP05540.1 sugar phosphate isomerase/epimerase [Jeotgalibaca ciconiae]HJB22612.1 sugar phosphate isomerase/epimerase [Candidatus Jeotgalibaca pullicola]
MAKIGVQGSTVKQQFQELGVYETMKKLSEIGYKSVEISQVETSPENIEAIQKACKDFDMEIAAMSASLEPQTKDGESLTTHYDKIVADCKAVDADLLRIGMLPIPAMASLDKVLEFCEKVNDVTKKLKEDGITLYYHNHHVEFRKYDGKFLLDIIREKAPLLGFELDVHWIQRGGANPLEVIRDYKGKVELIHLKDYRVGELPQESVDALFQGDASKFMDKFNNLIEFAELGSGTLPLKEIIEESLSSGVRYLLVEQDDTYGVDPFESLKISYEHLVELGYTELF